MKRRGLKLRARLALSFGALLALVVVVAAAGLLQLRALGAAGARQQQLAALQEQVTQWRALTGLNVARTVTLAKAGSPPALRTWMDGEMKETSGQISTVQKGLEQALVQPEEKRLMDAVAAARKSYVDLRVSLLQRLAAPATAREAMGEIETGLKPAAAQYLGSLDAVRDYVAARSRAEDAERQALLQRASVFLPGVTLLALVLGAVLAWQLARTLIQVIGRLRAAARRIAAGDLTQPVAVDRADELGELQHALAQMQHGLGRMVGGIRAGTDGVGTAATQIASGNDDLSARTERAASSLQQTAATMAQLSDEMRRASGSAGDAQRLADAAAAVARRGGQVVAEVVGTMTEINAGSTRISEITAVIDSLAFQTNILALNAAVEAARAGDEGRGFAVVATEVRNLAGRCAGAAGEIRGLIEDNVRKVETGSRLVRSAGSTMQEIEQGVYSVTQAIAGISAAASAQAGGFGEVNQAVSQLDQITQQNAALVEESAAAAQSLKDQAVSLVQAVSSFRLAPALA